MRRKLLKLLRQLEKESGYNNKYIEFNELFGCSYSIIECLDFPDYKFIIKKLNNDLEESAFFTPSNGIKAELKRMEGDGLIMIGVQEGTRHATTESNQGPDFEEGANFTIESIVLTTRGKSSKKYFISEAAKNPITSILSIIAIIISIITFFTSTK